VVAVGASKPSGFEAVDQPDKLTEDRVGLQRLSQHVFAAALAYRNLKFDRLSSANGNRLEPFGCCAERWIECSYWQPRATSFANSRALSQTNHVGNSNQLTGPPQRNRASRANPGRNKNLAVLKPGCQLNELRWAKHTCFGIYLQHDGQDSVGLGLVDLLDQKVEYHVVKQP